MKQTVGESRQMKWWGWGHPETRFHLDEHPGVGLLLRQEFGIEQIKARPQFNLDEIELADSCLSEDILSEIRKALGEDKVSTDRHDRVLHSFGKSYRDLIRIRTMKIGHPPDAVLYSESAQDVQGILETCQAHQIAVVPFGGGTSVVGGVEAERGEFKGVVSLDTSRLNQLLYIDDVSRTATFEAGSFGPDLEVKLNMRGYTLGHFSQSFEFSTLGGWIAARSSGQNSVLYGGIEKLVVSITLVSPCTMADCDISRTSISVWFLKPAGNDLAYAKPLRRISSVRSR